MTTAQPDLKELWALAEATVKGPWRVAGEYLNRVELAWDDEAPWRGSRVAADCDAPGVAAFIAASRTAVPRLLDRVTELERELEEMHSAALDAAIAAIQTNDRVDIAEKALADERRKREEAEARWVDLREDYHEAGHGAAQRENARLREALRKIAFGFDDGMGPTYYGHQEAAELASAALSSPAPKPPEKP